MKSSMANFLLLGRLFGFEFFFIRWGGGFGHFSFSFQFMGVLDLTGCLFCNLQSRICILLMSTISWTVDLMVVDNGGESCLK